MRRFLSLLFHGRFRELLLEPTDDGFIQFFRFLFVGGAATLVDIGAGWLFFHFCRPADLVLFGLTVSGGVQATAVGFLLGLVANYFLSILWVFRKANVNRVVEFLSFAAIGLVGLLVKSVTFSLLGYALPGDGDLIFLLKNVGGTLTANPLSCAAGYYAIDEIVRTDAAKKAGENGDKLCDGIRKLIDQYDLPFVTWNTGSIVHFEVSGVMYLDVQDPDIFQKIPERQHYIEQFGAALTANGVITLAGSRIYTSMADNDETIAQTLNAFEDVFSNIQK